MKIPDCAIPAPGSSLATPKLCHRTLAFTLTQDHSSTLFVGGVPTPTPRLLKGVSKMPPVTLCFYSVTRQGG